MKIKLIFKNILFIIILSLLLKEACFAFTNYHVETSSNPFWAFFNKKQIQLITKDTPEIQSQKIIALTIDDLPFVGEGKNFHLNMIIEALAKQHIPATGFIVAGQVHHNNWNILWKFRDSGLSLGNHTLTHANLNKIPTREYINEIKRSDAILSEILTRPKYFRYPYLAMGTGQKKQDVLCYLAEKNYRIAPVTIDSKDFLFNQRLLSVPEKDRRLYLEELKTAYLDFIWQQTVRAERKLQYAKKQAHVLLIHANLLNAYVLPDIINLYQKNGYQFVSLQNVLKTVKKPIQCVKKIF